MSTPAVVIEDGPHIKHAMRIAPIYNIIRIIYCIVKQSRTALVRTNMTKYIHEMQTQTTQFFICRNENGVVKQHFMNESLLRLRC